MSKLGSRRDSFHRGIHGGDLSLHKAPMTESSSIDGVHPLVILNFHGLRGGAGEEGAIQEDYRGGKGGARSLRFTRITRGGGGGS